MDQLLHQQRDAKSIHENGETAAAHAKKFFARSSISSTRASANFSFTRPEKRSPWMTTSISCPAIEKFEASAAGNPQGGNSTAIEREANGALAAHNVLPFKNMLMEQFAISPSLT